MRLQAVGGRAACVRHDHHVADHLCAGQQAVGRGHQAPPLRARGTGVDRLRRIARVEPGRVAVVGLPSEQVGHDVAVPVRRAGGQTGQGAVHVDALGRQSDFRWRGGGMVANGHLVAGNRAALVPRIAHGVDRTAPHVAVLQFSTADYGSGEPGLGPRAATLSEPVVDDGQRSPERVLRAGDRTGKIVSSRGVERGDGRGWGRGVGGDDGHSRRRGCGARGPVRVRRLDPAGPQLTEGCILGLEYLLLEVRPGPVAEPEVRVGHRPAFRIG